MSRRIRSDGSTTKTWEMARRINREIHTLAPVLKGLTNIGTFHHGPLWSGTRALPRSEEPLSVTVEGDPVSVGFFVRKGDGANSPRYVMMCNASPCDWARLSLKVNIGEEKLFCVDPKDGVIRELWPVNPRAQLVALSPGEGRLFQIGGEGQGKNF